MHILVIDANTAQGNQLAANYGCIAYGQHYANVLHSIESGHRYSIVQPSEQGEATNDNLNWSDIDGVVWSGSPLNIYNRDEAIMRQLKFGEHVLKQGKPVFGSCWGLQILVKLLGGEVHRNPRGLEFGVARDIAVNEAGAKHPMLQGRARSFSALAVHYDEILRLPEGAIIFAGNNHSPIQAISYQKAGVDVWAVQYHPEFDLLHMTKIMKRLANDLIARKFFIDEDQLNQTAADWAVLDDDPSRSDLSYRYDMTADIYNKTKHRLELQNWLQHLALSQKTISDSALATA